MYLYRFDLIERLRNQADDPVLRARRVCGPTGQFDHHQAITALGALADGQGVYRFCFWKTWEAAVRHFPLFDQPNGAWIMQRIRTDHGSLERFHRGDDEYLVEDAWIYWHCSEIVRERPEWSPVGIPHDDIEVLNPGGFWEPLTGSAILRDTDLDGWNAQFLRGIGGGVCPVYTRAITRRVDSLTNVWVLIRQKSGPWTSLLHSDDLLESCVATQIPQLERLRHDQVRWVIAGEFSDRVLAYEIFPQIALRSTATGLKAWLQRMAGVGRRELVVNISDTHRQPLGTSVLKALYRDFGIDDVLKHKQRYRYRENFLSSRQESP